MSVETSTARPAASFRADVTTRGEAAAGGFETLCEQPWRFVALITIATAFVLIGGASLDLGPLESRLGLAAREGCAPLGRVFAGWDPTVWPAQLAPSALWAWFEGGAPTSNSVRWPAAIAGVVAGLILARRAASRLGGRAGLLTGLCWFGSLGLMDRSAGAGLDLITGLATIAAFDRLLGRGSDLMAGAWLSLAFLAGGWPPVAIVWLATVVIGRHGATLNWRTVVPPVLAAIGWSAWALNVLPSEAWGAALTLPLTRKPAWWLVPGVVALGLPWSPLALLAARRSIRGGWSDQARWFVAWGQVAIICLLAGTVVPGFATAARPPALAGLALLAGASCHTLLARPMSAEPGARRWFFGSMLVLTLAWTVLVVFGGGYLAAAVPYYRALAVGLIAASLPLVVLALLASSRRDARLGVLTFLALAVCLRLAHWGYYTTEWNYRYSQGPWGRAIGQWVPPSWPIYTTHAWPADLAFATGRSVYQLPSERHLEYEPDQMKFVLLLASEFENWPEQAPPLLTVAQFQDEHGQPRVLARTHGDLPWSSAVLARRGKASRVAVDE
jgi:hypothetical protein